MIEKRENHKKLPKNLTLEEGLSHEEICKRLDENIIPYQTGWLSPHDLHTYFRASYFFVSSDLRSDVIDLLGSSDLHKGGADFFYGYYKIKKSFDMKILSGAITFDKGRLVERMSIRYVNE